MTKLFAIAGVIGLLGAGTGWMTTSAADATRPDCPGKIVCPLNGEQVCADRCPANTIQEPAPNSNAAEELCGGACPAPAPAPKPDKPKGEGDSQSAVANPTNPAAMKAGCCR